MTRSINRAKKREGDNVPAQDLKKSKISMIRDHAIHKFRKETNTRIQLKSILGETVNLLIVLTINMIESQRRKVLYERSDILAPMIQIG